MWGLIVVPYCNVQKHTNETIGLSVISVQDSGDSAVAVEAASTLTHLSKSACQDRELYARSAHWRFGVWSDVAADGIGILARGSYFKIPISFWRNPVSPAPARPQHGH